MPGPCTGWRGRSSVRVSWAASRRSRRNVVGSLILGLVTGAVAAGAGTTQVQLLIGTGLCGAPTTYSTLSYETLRLSQDGARLFAVADVVGSLTAGLGAAFLGAALAQAIWA
ncbi:fluoride efflux transporter FluC [Streptomyces sp. NPDC090442]|uniref:fluoride efflux transporter FluC n=1 Tax=Streptomyces sp. NPDC090442 TaxID=3365962 RepID=UPI003808F335